MRRREFMRAAAVGGVGATAVSLPAGGKQPYSPLGSVAIENAKEAVVAGETAFVATTDGFATVDVSDPRNPTPIAERRGLLAERADGPLQQVWDVKVEGDRLLVVGPANPVEGDVFRGLLLYDVSDPANPEQVAVHETTFPIHNAVLRDGVAYLTSNNGDGNPLVMVDVSGDDPEEVGRWSMLDYDESWSEVDPWVRTLHDLWVQDGVAYLSQWDAGTWVVDVSDPASPSHLAHFSGRSHEELAALSGDAVQDGVIGLPGNHHFVSVNDDASLLVSNKEAWDANPDDDEGGPGGLELWDITTLDDPRQVATIDPPPTPDPTYSLGGLGDALAGLDSSSSAGVAGVGAAGLGSGVVLHSCHDCTGGSQGSGVWTTSHNFEIVGDRLYTSWYQGGVKLFDVSDPASPEELAWWRDPEATAFWTAQRLTDDAFVASSMGRNGNGKGGLYTFPNRPGEQQNPPELVGNGTGGEPSAPQRAGNGTTTADERTSTTDSGATTVDQPGFGVLAGVAGVAVGAWAKFRD